MSIVAFPLHIAKCLVQVRVDIERRAAQRADPFHPRSPVGPADGLASPLFLPPPADTTNPCGVNKGVPEGLNEREVGLAGPWNNGATLVGHQAAYRDRLGEHR